MTGWATLVDGEWSAEAIPGPAVGECVWDYCERWKGLRVVCESFHISSQTAKKGQKPVLEAIELIGVCRWICRRFDVPFETQPPSDAKMFADDKKLRAMGWWYRGSDHPRDASRHLLLYCARHQIIDLSDLRGKLDENAG